MSDKPENPPAFACAAENGHQEGMTLRDYFAAAALQGILSSPNTSDVIGTADVAAGAYAFADEMLKARQS